MDTIAKDWHEWRRLRAVRLKDQGWLQRSIADALGVSEVSVSHWLTRAHDGGLAALHTRPGAGRQPKLSCDQMSRIPEFLWHGPEAYGFRGQVWTCARIASVLKEEFGVSYHKAHVSRSLRELHWTPQIPIKRAIQRDEEAIRRWRDDAWPRLRWQARHERRTLVFVDESGFYLLPGVVKTYSPQGRTPILTAKLTRDHLSVMGGMTPQGKVYTLARQESLNGFHSVEFLFPSGEAHPLSFYRLLLQQHPKHQRLRRTGAAVSLPYSIPQLDTGVTRDACQRCGSNSSRRSAGWVGKRASTSRR